jgi:Flp pilus assembly protein protease CpaA
MPALFPNLPFAILFVVILVAGLGYAAYVDWKTMKVPKWLTVGLFGSGVAINAIQGGWLGWDGGPVWILGADNAFFGTLTGILYSLAGFLTGFVLFFVFWIFGLSGGGDVKLVGAAGAWLGWYLVLIGVLLSLPFLIVLTLSVTGYRVAKGKLPKVAATKGKGQQRTVMTYSLPFALGVYVVLSLLMVRYVQFLNDSNSG